MNCADARQGLWPPERPRLVGDEVVAARMHVETCAECREYFEQDHLLLELYDRARHEPAPLEVRERVFDAIAIARAREARTLSPASHWVHRAALPSAALLAVAALLLLGTLRTGEGARTDTATTAFVEDYLRRAVGEDRIETDDPAEVRRFLRRELGMPLEPLQLAGLAVVSAEICLLEGRRGAMIVYESDGSRFSHYLVPHAGGRYRAPTLSEPTRGSAGGEMPVVTWSTPQVEQALVGEVGSARRLLDLARTAAALDG